MHPALPVAAALAAIGGGIWWKLNEDKKTAGGGGAPKLTPGTKIPPIVIPKDPENPKSAQANAVAHLTQPPFSTPPSGRPDPQPPLPPAPPPEELPPGTKAIVSTKETGQAGALRVRSKPSTAATPVPGGEPETGGGVPHGATLYIDGQEESGFVHIKYQNLSGYAWAGYLTKVPAMSGDDMGVEPDFEARLAATSNLPARPTGFDSYSDYLRKAGRALQPAHALYAYLKSNGSDPEEMKSLVKRFQQSHNMDRYARAIAGHLRSDGCYDPLTSAALTAYTGDPIPGDVRYQPKQATLGQALANKVIGQDGSNTGVAYRSGYNAARYLQLHGEDSSQDLQSLVQQFQHDMNTDPLFPGPEYKIRPFSGKRFPKVVETGDLGPSNSATRRAMSMMGLYS